MCFHKWSKWEEFIENQVLIPGVFAPSDIQGKKIDIAVKKQKRYCLKCGYIKEKIIDD